MTSRPRSGLVAAIVVGLVGFVFVLQGLGAPIGRSFMIGDLRWAVIGLVMVVAATVFVWRTLRGSP